MQYILFQNDIFDAKHGDSSLVPKMRNEMNTDTKDALVGNPKVRLKLNERSHFEGDKKQPYLSRLSLVAYFQGFCCKVLEMLLRNSQNKMFFASPQRKSFYPWPSKRFVASVLPNLLTLFVVQLPHVKQDKILVKIQKSKFT